uniref:Uncharacterized protein n=1 Tax=Picea glauca TaxID=3330 RepID=A0A101M083_PICGL|nr:hypothetical protein ABT39_MTgene4478 [Picea glauca]
MNTPLFTFGIYPHRKSLLRSSLLHGFVELYFAAIAWSSLTSKSSSYTRLAPHTLTEGYLKSKNKG